jgi:hypothetical protein
MEISGIEHHGGLPLGSSFSTAPAFPTIIGSRGTLLSFNYLSFGANNILDYPFPGADICIYMAC